MKYGERDTSTRQEKVAPFVGARIEMDFALSKKSTETVAPFVGARIEIIVEALKAVGEDVAPFVGARIEIALSTKIGTLTPCRSLRGSAD